MKTLESRIVDAIIEFDDFNGDEMRRQELLESFADEATEEFMSETLGMNDDATFAIIRPAVLKAIEKGIDWSKVDAELDEIHKDTMEWFHNRMEAIFS